MHPIPTARARRRTLGPNQKPNPIQRGGPTNLTRIHCGVPKYLFVPGREHKERALCAAAERTRHSFREATVGKSNYPSKRISINIFLLPAYFLACIGIGPTY